MEVCKEIIDKVLTLKNKKTHILDTEDMGFFIFIGMSGFETCPYNTSIDIKYIPFTLFTIEDIVKRLQAGLLASGSFY